MTGVKQYLHIYSKDSCPKLVFEDNSSGDTEVYGLMKCNGITFIRVAYVNGLKHNLISISQLCDANFKVLFTKTQGTIFNQNNEVVLIAPRRRVVSESDKWPVLSTGVKFSPFDVKLLEHLAEKCGVGNGKPHLYIDVLPLTTLFHRSCFPSLCSKLKEIENMENAILNIH
ncbi:hypothetical protein Tco_0804503 [Tanacetum coccineum]|uniref:Uncharacterized protein n=1 Tax=Tanacetum coccineum TaxID=301880 RepID=A0ABQ5A5D2_9ASTR